MEAYQEKAWEMLTSQEKNSLFLQMTQGQSSWEAGEIMGVPHYKYLEIKERSIKFFKMFSDYLLEFNTLIGVNSVIDNRFRDFVEAILEKRLPKSEALIYSGDSSLTVNSISDKLIIKNMERLRDSEYLHDRRLYDLIMEFDRWNNKRVLPKALQLPSAYKRRNNKRGKTYIMYISNLPEHKVKAISDIFVYKPRSSRKKRYYITLISSMFDDGYSVITVKPSKDTIDKLSKLSIFIFDDPDKADAFGFLITRFLDNPQTPKTGQVFWANYREYTSMAINYDRVNSSDFYTEKLDVAYDLVNRKGKKLKQRTIKTQPARRADPELFYSKR